MTKVSGYNNSNIINIKKILVASIALVFLLPSIIFTHQSQTMLLSLLSHQQQSSSSSFLSSPIPSLAYADKIKIKNKSLINDISDQLVKNNSGNNSKDELQSILQQVQMQISLIAGQDKATNAIKQIESVIDLNPNGPLAQSLLFLTKQQATGNIEDVNKVITDSAKYAAAGGDSIVGSLEQSVASLSSSSITPLSPQQQEQQPSQSLPSSSTIASFDNNSSNTIDNSNSSLMSTLPQLTPELIQSQGSPRPLSQTTGPPLSERPANNLDQHNQVQIAQSQPIEEQQQEQEQVTPPVLARSEQQQQIKPQSDIDTSKPSTSPISSSISPLVNSQNQSPAPLQSLPATSVVLPPSQASTSPDDYNKVNNTAYDDSKTNNANDADNISSNSMPQSTIKVTSIDRSTEPGVTLSMSNSTKQQYQSDEREQLQQRIQEIMNQFSSANSNDVASLPKYIERN